MKRFPKWLLAGGMSVALAVPAAADPVIFLGQQAYIDDVPAHAAERRLRGSGTYDDPYYYDDEPYAEEAYERPRYEDRGPRRLRPRQVARMLRARGFRAFSDFERFRDIYGVSATDPEGYRVRIAVDAVTGEIRDARVIGAAYRDYDGYDDDDYYEPRSPRRGVIERRDMASPPRATAIEPPQPPDSRPGVRTRREMERTAAVRPELVTPPLPKARPKPAATVAAVDPVKPKEPGPAGDTGSTVSLDPPAAAPKKQPAGSGQAAVAPPPSQAAGTDGPPTITYKPPVAENGPPAEELQAPGKNPLVVY